MSVNNEIAPFKEVRVKTRTEEWFDSEVSESIKVRYKLFKNLRNQNFKLIGNYSKQLETALRA